MILITSSRRKSEMNKHQKYFTRKVYEGSNLTIPEDKNFDVEFFSWKEYIEDMWEHGYSIEEAIEDINFKLEGIPTWEWNEANNV